MERSFDGILSPFRRPGGPLQARRLRWGPWLCVPAFRRVCLYRTGVTRLESAEKVRVSFPASIPVNTPNNSRSRFSGRQKKTRTFDYSDTEGSVRTRLAYGSQM